MNETELLQKIGDVVCEGCGPNADCGVNPEECDRIEIVRMYLYEYLSDCGYIEMPCEAD